MAHKTASNNDNVSHVELTWVQGGLRSGPSMKITSELEAVSSPPRKKPATPITEGKVNYRNFF